MKLVCPGCKAEFSYIETIEIDGLAMLRVGTFIIREAQGICMTCGRVIYWSVSNKVIAAIVKDAMLEASSKGARAIIKFV
jgi:hypothetical protein